MVRALQQLSYLSLPILPPIEPRLQLGLGFLAFVQLSIKLVLEYSMEPLSSQLAFQHPVTEFER
jgi:hypothetical protein